MRSDAPRDHRYDVSGWVYFVHAEGACRVKIGFTADHPDRRIRSIQVSSPEPLRKLGVIPGTLGTERLLHRRFRALNTHAEWFVSHPVLMEFIRAECSPWPGVGTKVTLFTYEESRRLNSDLAARSFSDLAARERERLDAWEYRKVVI